MSARKATLPIVLLLTLCVTACATPATPEGTPETVTPSSATEAPSPRPSDTPRPTFTNLPPTATPIPGKTTYKINVRAGPGAAYATLGMLETNQEVQIVGRNEEGSWYLILYPAGPAGQGWITAQYVSLPPGVVVPTPAEATNTPTGPIGKATQRLNVRSGPGMSFDVLGVLEVGTLVPLTGKNQNGAWVQIEYPGGPNDRGWVTAAYIQSEALGSLPVLDDYGNPVTPGAQGPTSVPRTPTPTIGPAYADNDSEANPAVRAVFSSYGTRQVIYSSDVSTPDGDAGDWIAFTTYAPAGFAAQITMSLVCSGNGRLEAELLQGGIALEDWGPLTCNAPALSVELTAEQEYVLHLSPMAGDGLEYVYYTVVIQNGP